MIEVALNGKPNLIRETLNRIGICNRKKHIIYPSVYLYEKDDKFYLIHFKEHFILTRDNAYNNLTKQDEDRTMYVASLLRKWNLIQFENSEPIPKDKIIYILKKSETEMYKVNHKIKF